MTREVRSDAQSKRNAYRQYGNHGRDHKRSSRRRRVASRRVDDSGNGAAGGGLESDLGMDPAQRRDEAREKTIDEWVGGLSSFSAARRRQDTFVETTLLDLLDAGACVPACARILHVSFDKLYYRTKSSAALRRGTGREQAHMSAARAAQGEDVRDTLIDAEELARMDVKDLSPDGPNTDRLDEETISRGRQEYREAVVQGRVQANRWLLDKLRCRVFGRKSGISKEFMRLWVGVSHQKCRHLRRLAVLSVAHGDPHLEKVFFHQNTYTVQRAGGPHNKLSEEHAQLIFDFFDKHTVEMPDSKGEAVWSNPEINTQGVYVNTFTAQGSTHTATADVALQHQQASRESLIPDPLHPPPETSLRLTASPSFELRFALFASPLSDGP